MYSSRAKSNNLRTQIHVSLAGPGYMKVSWMTADKNVPSTVQYGIQSGKLLQTASGVSTSYRFITYQSGQMHHVKIGPLQDSTTYFYRCGGYGPEYNFTTPPPSGPSEPVKFAVVGRWLSSGPCFSIRRLCWTFCLLNSITWFGQPKSDTSLKTRWVDWKMCMENGSQVI